MPIDLVFVQPRRIGSKNIVQVADGSVRATGELDNERSAYGRQSESSGLRTGFLTIECSTDASPTLKCLCRLQHRLSEKHSVHPLSRTAAAAARGATNLSRRRLSHNFPKIWIAGMNKLPLSVA
jgi:hypothetical protein